MNIYEMLKAGESIESIRMAFGKELAEASDKLRKEKETERTARNLAIAREDLLDSIIEYIETYLEILYGCPCPFSDEGIEEIKQEFIEQEKELKTYIEKAPLTSNEIKDELIKFIKEYVLTYSSIKGAEFPF